MIRCIVLIICTAMSISLTAGHRAEVNRWEAQLAQLVPIRPMEYFVLAEDVADAAVDSDEIALARHLFALAGALDMGGLGRSAALALAELEDRPVVRDQLLAVAALLDERTAPSWEPTASVQHSAESILAFGDALSAYRQGRGANAISALREADAMTILETYGSFLPGGSRRFLEDCGVHRSGPRPNITTATLERMLKVEEGLLSKADRSWSADLVLMAGKPLVEIDPANVEQTFGVNGSRPYYRNGRWVSNRTTGE